MCSQSTIDEITNFSVPSYEEADIELMERVMYLKPGASGFLLNCANRSADRVLNLTFKLLYGYADQLYGIEAELHKEPEPESADTVEDIGSKLKKECEQIIAKHNKNWKSRRFQLAFTSVNEFFFIETDAYIDPFQLGEHIAKDIARNGYQLNDYMLRLIPIEVVCEFDHIMDKAGQLADKHFKEQGRTFSISFHCHFSLVDDDGTPEINVSDFVDLIKSKNSDNRVDWQNPQLTLIVMILEDLCLLSVIKGRHEYEQYNLTRSAAASNANAPSINGMDGQCEAEREPVQENQEAESND